MSSWSRPKSNSDISDDNSMFDKIGLRLLVYPVQTQTLLLKTPLSQHKHGLPLVGSGGQNKFEGAERLQVDRPTST